jgi:putative nucleotidyltransferase with HDIG domain
MWSPASRTPHERPDAHDRRSKRSDAPHDAPEVRPDPTERAVRRWSERLAAWHPATHAHASAVARLASAMARDLGRSDAEVEHVARAARLHDVGKLWVPRALLDRQGPLSRRERARLADHPMDGARLLASDPNVCHLALPVREHHERWDGSGYPHGIAGRSIAFAARLVALADACEAIVAGRPYRPARPASVAMAELRAGAGRQFDPELVDVVVRGPRSLAALSELASRPAQDSSGAGASSSSSSAPAAAS